MYSKLKKVSKVSDPEIVIMKARQYFKNPDIQLYLSPEKNKKYSVFDPINKKLVHFGDIRYEDFTKHKDDIRRESYLKRANNIKGDWKNNIYSPNNLSINLLWT